jgi:DNA modification methylase
MAKKSGTESTAKTPSNKVAKNDNSLARRTGEGRGEGRPSALVDTRVIYCGDNLDQIKKLPDACVDLIYIDPPFNSNRNYEVFWPETSEKRRFDDRHESTTAYIVKTEIKHGDCIDVLAQYADNTFDLIVSSPPI